MSAELQVIDDGYSLAQYLSERVARFPRSHRHTIGAEIVGRCLAMLGELVRAKYMANGAAKRVRLADLNTELEVLRFLLRLAHDLKALPHDSYHHACERLLGIGRQLGGWIKAIVRGGT